MDARLKIPPNNKKHLTSLQGLAIKLKPLINTKFVLTGKSRTDGSNIRKLVADKLINSNPPETANKNVYDIIPPKGVPKILLEYVDTYIVTTGKSYNLQVWNRNPSSESVQILYSNGETLQSGEVRFVLVKVDPENHIISSIAILTPKYIVKKFGVFGKPTIKNQLIISSILRKNVIEKPGSILLYDDAIGNKQNLENLSHFSIHDQPTSASLLPLSTIKDIVIDKVIGSNIAPAATKNRGQKLEQKLAEALGYVIGDNELLAGGYPDLRNQALEVKIQDSATVDLGKFSPEFEKEIPSCEGFTTRNMRYFIALTNPKTNIVEGAVLCQGNKLGLHFTYVAEESYKCQRSIPMSFFKGIQGLSVVNP